MSQGHIRTAWSLPPRSSYIICRSKCKMKIWGLSSEIVRILQSDSRTLSQGWAFLSRGRCAAFPAHAHKASPCCLKEQAMLSLRCHRSPHAPQKPHSLTLQAFLSPIPKSPSHHIFYHNLSIQCVLAESLQSCQTVCDPMDLARRAPLSMGSSRQEYWSGLPFPSPGNSSQPRDLFPTQGSNPCLLCLLHYKQILYH